MGSNTSSKLGCISAPIDDGEASYTSVKTRSNAKEMSYSSTISPISPPTPSISHSSHSSHSYDYYPYRKQNIKILFLDVDGVLNNRFTEFNEYTNGIDNKLLKYLKLILLKTHCKIVLSTTWRLNNKAKAILLHTIKTRADINVDDIIIGQTKDLKYLGKNRTYEIFDYMKTNKNKYNIISWCAIDDISLNKFNDNGFSETIMHGHFVKTNPKNGITPKNVFDCINILNHY